MSTSDTIYMFTIVYLINQLRKSGPVHVLKGTIENLDREKFHPVIIKFMQDDKKRSITHEFIQMGVEVYEMNLSFIELELKTSKVAHKLDALLRKIAPDIIHTHGYHPVLVASKLKYVCPKIETLHCICKENFISIHGFWIGYWMNLRYINCLRKMDCLVAISKTVQKFYKQLFPMMNVQSIYNGVNINNFNLLENKDELRKKLNIDASVVFVVIGTLSKGKDPETVIKAFKKASLNMSDVNMSLLFIGQGVLKERCLRLIGDDDRIKLVGYVFNVPDYLGAADFSICASHSEGFGLNFIESVIAGVPVISSKIGPFEEFVNLYNQLNLLQFSPGNVDQLADKICKAVESIHSIEMASAQHDASLRFSATRMAESYMNLYLDLL